MTPLSSIAKQGVAYVWTKVSSITFAGTLKKTRSCAIAAFKCLCLCQPRDIRWPICHLILLREGYTLQSCPDFEGFAIAERHNFDEEADKWVTTYVLRDAYKDSASSAGMLLAPSDEISEVANLRKELFPKTSSEDLLRVVNALNGLGFLDPNNAVLDPTRFFYTDSIYREPPEKKSI